MNWLSSVPIVFALPLFAIVFAGAAIGAHLILRPILPSAERLSEHHEVPGFMMGVVGVLYSVVLGFLVGTVWTAFATAQQTADLEAGYISDAFNFAGQLPPPQGKILRRVVARYAIIVRDQNWSAGQTGSGAQLLYQALRLATSISAQGTSVQILETNNIITSEINSLRQIADARRLQIVQAQSRLPAGLLEALILGAVGVIAFTFLFGVRSNVKRMFMIGLLAASIGLFFGLIVELSMPYSGAIHVSRDSLNFVIENNRLEQIAR